ncbi:hypothetical protein [Chitinophaga sp. YIM B06452]|uniref:hypothetical protein n=1 Tax=Chitinophaga sp. YIM B06452 TaxID=3082158 RepID=UPI0031FF3508
MSIKYFRIAGLACFLLGCRVDKPNLNLLYSDSALNAESDTLEIDSARGLMIVRIIDRKALGKFSQSYAIVSDDPAQHLRGYKITNLDKYGVRISNELISFVKPFGVTNWGWFAISNGKTQDTLPGASEITKRLREENADFFISETNGYFSAYKNGKLIKIFNYGSWKLSDSLDFDKLVPGLYKLETGRLQQVSGIADDLFKQPEGIFFIPSPDYGAVANYSKEKILQMISIEMKKKQPSKKLQVAPEQF